MPFVHHFLSQNSCLAKEVLPLIDFTSVAFINTEVVSSTNLSKLIGDILLRFSLKKQ